MGCKIDVSMRCLGVQEKIWIAPKGMPLELMVQGVICFGCPQRPSDKDYEASEDLQDEVTV